MFRRWLIFIASAALAAASLLASCTGPPIVILPPPAASDFVVEADGTRTYAGQLPIGFGADALVILYNTTTAEPASTVASPTGCYVITGLNAMDTDELELSYRRVEDLAWSDPRLFRADLMGEMVEPGFTCP